MKSPQGKIERFKTYRTKKPVHNKPELPTLDVNTKDYLCKVNGRSQLEMLDLVEVDLELKALVDDLKNMKKPRSLSLNQKVLVSEVPFCYPFVTDLMIISKLLKGYDLVKVAKR